jgi:hypothetical protein
VQSAVSSWLKTGTQEGDGAQIDLLIDRADHCINICEMKYTTGPFTINKKYSRELQNKLAVFREHTNARKTLILTFITTYGLNNNDYKDQLVDAELTMDALFT